jgi:hypothetical protein
LLLRYFEHKNRVRDLPFWPNIVHTPQHCWSAPKSEFPQPEYLAQETVTHLRIRLVEAVQREGRLRVLMNRTVLEINLRSKTNGLPANDRPTMVVSEND